MPQQDGGESMEIEINQQYNNTQILVYGLIIIFFISILFYLVWSMPLIDIISGLILMVILVGGLYIFFTNYEKKLGRRVMIFKDDEWVLGYYRNANKFVPAVKKPVKYEWIYEINIKNRLLRFYYTIDGKKYFTPLPLKAVFMDEDERKRRKKILEELLKRVKRANPDVKIIDMRRREKKKLSKRR